MIECIVIGVLVVLCGFLFDKLHHSRQLMGQWEVLSIQAHRQIGEMLNEQYLQQNALACVEDDLAATHELYASARTRADYYMERSYRAEAERDDLRKRIVGAGEIANAKASKKK